MKKPLKLSFSILFVLLFVRTVVAFDLPPLTGPVVDTVGVLPQSVQNSLEKILRSENQKGKAQIQVLILKNLQGIPIEQASIQIVDKWKLGTAQADNGILFLISLEDRRLRIEVGQGLEGDLTDVQSQRIIRELVAPRFKQQDYAAGITAGILAIIHAIDPEFSTQEYAQNIPEKLPLPKGFILFFALLVIIIILQRLGGGGGGRGFRGGPWLGGGGLS